MSLITVYLVIQTLLLVLPNVFGIVLEWHVKYFPTIVVIVYYVGGFVFKKFFRK